MFPESGSLNDKAITIQLLLDGFSYVVYCTSSQKYIHLEHINEENPSLRAAIQRIEAEHSCNIADFTRFIVVFNNCQNTFVPAAIFQNSARDKYLDFLGIKTGGRKVVSELLSGIEAQNVYSISADDAATLSEMQGDTSYFHAGSVLVSSLMRTNVYRSNEPNVFINVKNLQFDMIVTKGCNLLFYNTFKFKTKEDFLYFLLFPIEQLHLDTEAVPVYFLGMIEEKSQLVELSSRYIRNIRFVKHNNDMSFTEEIEKTPYFHNYLLFNSITCEL